MVTIVGKDKMKIAMRTSKLVPEKCKDIFPTIEVRKSESMYSYLSVSADTAGITSE